MNRFINETKKKAAENGIKIVIQNSDLVYAPGESEGSAGYFDSERKVLAVAKKGKTADWMGIFVHESCHMDQWIENNFMWEKLSLGYDLFFRWLDGEEVSEEILSECVQDIIRLEKDCEQRSIKKIKQYELDIDLVVYRKKANSYLYGYLFFLEIREWIPKVYLNSNIWKSAPSRFPKQYTKIPRKLYRALKQAYERQIAK